MSLIVEDGTAKSDAESYASVAFADSYHSARGNASWAALTTEQKEQALRKASDYISNAYGSKLAGYRATDTQALEFPRQSLPKIGVSGGDYLTTEMPVDLLRAAAILALKTVAETLFSDVGRLTKTETVDVLSVEYVDGAATQTKYTEVDALMSKFFAGAVVDGRFVGGSGINRQVVR